MNCGICGEPFHGTRQCWRVLKEALDKARGVDRLVDFDFLPHPVNVHLSTPESTITSTVDTPAVDKRKAYQREWARQRRAKS